mmetsp:Transcript_899/g.1163  ORF Transcript_899/g.1163 Transcript_899/m.1163 type:complete len:395 (-) Transcript_899:91-1275(-)
MKNNRLPTYITTTLVVHHPENPLIGFLFSLAVPNVVISGKVTNYEFSCSMSIQVITHIISLTQHISTHLVETGCTNHVACTIYLPGNGRVSGAHLIITRGSSGGTGILGNLHTHFQISVNNHTSHHIRPVVIFIIHNGEYLSLYADLLGQLGQIKTFSVTENSIIKRSLELVHGTAITSSRVRPVNLISLTYVHIHAVLPIILFSKLRILGIIMMTPQTKTSSFRQTTLIRSNTVLIVLTFGTMLGTQMPMHVHGTHRRHEVRIREGFYAIGLEVTGISVRHIRTGLNIHDDLTVHETVFIGNLDLGTGTRIGSGNGFGSGCTGVVTAATGRFRGLGAFRGLTGLSRLSFGTSFHLGVNFRLEVAFANGAVGFCHNRVGSCEEEDGCSEFHAVG